MKKSLAAAAALGMSAIIAAPATAALTTALPDGERLWVMPVGDGEEPGQIRELDPTSGELTDVFVGSAVTSDKWVVGADYDATTNSVLWIKDYNEPAEALVRYDVETGDETVYAFNDASNIDVRGIDITNGAILVSLNYYVVEDDVWVKHLASVSLDEDSLTATLTDMRDIDGEYNQSGVAVDPTDDQVYVLDYSCALFSVDEANALTAIDSLTDYLDISSDCVAIDFDSNGRAWVTTGDTGRLVSFDPDDVNGTIEASDWTTPDNQLYGEAVFVATESLTVQDDTLASTGFDAGMFVASAATLLGAGSLVALSRRRRAL